MQPEALQPGGHLERMDGEALSSGLTGLMLRDSSCCSITGQHLVVINECPAIEEYTLNCPGQNNKMAAQPYWKRLRQKKSVAESE